MPTREAPCVELGTAPEIQSLPASSSPSDLSSASSPEPHQLQATPLFRALAMPPLPPVQPDGQEELERRLPGYRRFVLPREQTLIEILKESSGVRTDEEVLGLRSVKIRVVAERVGLRRLHVLAPRLRILTLDGSALASLRDLGTGLSHLKELHICRCGLATLDGILGLNALRELYASGNRIRDLEPLAALRKLHTLDLSNNPVSESTRIWTLGVCGSLRRLCLRGSPVASALDYHRRIASSLPALQYLDDFPLNETALDELDELFGPASSGSESETEDNINKTTQPIDEAPPPQTTVNTQNQEHTLTWIPKLPHRPATAPCASSPAAPARAQRPHTACAGAAAVRAPVTNLELLNSLIDEESRCSGSELTSGAAMCGNVARALRPRRLHSASSTSSQPSSLHGHIPLDHDLDTSRDRSSLHDRSSSITTNDRSTHSHSSHKPGKCTRNSKPASECAAGCSCVGSRSTMSMMSAVDAMASASQLVAAEIPIPGADWAAFRRSTGIDFELTPDARPEAGDPSEVISRLEKIEQETQERLRREEKRMEVQETKEEAEGADYKMSLLDKFLREE